MCDCILATGSFEHEKFAGVYCEHKATSYCKRKAFFCTNGGECRDYDDGCKCPPNYEGHYCQFVKGARPSDWSAMDYMHPALVNAYHNSSSRGGSNGNSMSVVGIVAIVGCVIVVVGFLTAAFAGGRLKLPASIGSRRRGQKEMETAASNNTGSEFVAGASVYKKKSSSGAQFVTEDTLEADGAVLTAALEGSGGDSAMMEEVNLDDDDDDKTPTASGGGSASVRNGELI